MKGTVNKVILIGRLGKDPEMKGTKGDHIVGKLSVATNNYDGSTQWHNVEVWDKVAQAVDKYTQKGSKLYIEGRLKTDKYEKDGTTRYSTKIVATSVQFLSDKNDKVVSEGAYSTKEEYRQQLDDDLPF